MSILSSTVAPTSSKVSAEINKAGNGASQPSAVQNSIAQNSSAATVISLSHDSKSRSASTGDEKKVDANNGGETAKNEKKLESDNQKAQSGKLNVVA